MSATSLSTMTNSMMNTPADYTAALMSDTAAHVAVILMGPHLQGTL